MRAVLLTILVSVVTAVTMVTGMTLSREKRQNYDALLQNKAFVESQINCVLGRGQCDRIGHRIKHLVPEVVQTKECKSCTEEERGNVQKVADHVKNNYPKEWNEIKDQYTEEHGSGEKQIEEEEVLEDERQQRLHDEDEEELTGSQEDAQMNIPEDIQANIPEEVQETRQENEDNNLRNGQQEETSSTETLMPN